jgi:hypothetical protein
LNKIYKISSGFTRLPTNQAGDGERGAGGETANKGRLERAPHRPRSCESTFYKAENQQR